MRRIGCAQFLPLMFLLISAITCGPARAAEFVVVEARGIPLHAGQSIDDQQPLVLTEGQRVTLVSPDGDTLKLKGPFNGKPGANAGAAGSGNVTEALTALLVQKQTRDSDVGVVRAGEAPPKLPEPWLVDVSRAGTNCYCEGGEVVFWRPDSAEAAEFTIRPLDHRWSLSRNWAAGSDRLKAPPDLRISGRVTYLADLGGKRAAVTLIPIPATARTDAMRAAWMLGKGCLAQATALMEGIRK